MSYTIIENASETEKSGTFDAAVSALISNLTIDHVNFRDVNKSVHIRDGSLSLTNSTFAESNSGEQVHVEDATAFIENCTFYDVSGGDAIDFEGVDGGMIRGCTVISSEDDGIDIGENSVNITIEDSKLYDCDNKGISVGQNSSVTINYTVVTDSEEGIAVFDGSYAIIDHVTLYDNDISLTCLNKTENSGGGTVIITNSVFSLSHDKTLVTDDVSEVTVSYCLSDTEKLMGAGNIFDNPRFFNPDLKDFSLLPESPCIDSGNPESTPDSDDSRTDIGAFYYQDTGIVINEINYNSSPLFNTGDWIELYNPLSYALDISGWIFNDEDDNHIFKIPEGTILKSDNYLVLCADNDAFSERYPEVNNKLGNFDFGLSGSSELVRLYSNKGVLIDSLTYGDDTPWPLEPDGSGHTLSLINPELDNSVAHNWKASIGTGTPGVINDVFDSVDEEDSYIASPIQLGQNYPNPFNNVTTIPLTILEACTITVDIYTILGQKYKTILRDFLRKGQYSITFDATDLSSGIYFCRIEAGGYIRTMPMMLVK